MSTTDQQCAAHKAILDAHEKQMDLQGDKLHRLSGTVHGLVAIKEMVVEIHQEVCGTPQTPGLRTRVKILEDKEARRRWFERTLQGAIVVSLLTALGGWLVK